MTKRQFMEELRSSLEGMVSQADPKWKERTGCIE